MAGAAPLVVDHLATLFVDKVLLAAIQTSTTLLTVGSRTRRLEMRMS